MSISKKMIRNVNKIKQVLTHLSNLESNFRKCFSGLTVLKHVWIQNPFAVVGGDKVSQLSIKSQESLLELAYDTPLKIQYRTLPLLVFGFISEMTTHSTTSHQHITFLAQHTHVQKLSSNASN
jgi:hypothetical protein